MIAFIRRLISIYFCAGCTKDKRGLQFDDFFQIFGFVFDLAQKKFGSGISDLHRGDPDRGEWNLHNAAEFISSNPMRETSSGTRILRSNKAFITPMATRSLKQKIAVGFFRIQ